MGLESKPMNESITIVAIIFSKPTTMPTTIII